MVYIRYFDSGSMDDDLVFVIMDVSGAQDLVFCKFLCC